MRADQCMHAAYKRIRRKRNPSIEMLAVNALVVQKEAHVHKCSPNRQTVLFNLNNCLELSTAELDLYSQKAGGYNFS